MSETYFISDLHFNHFNILDFERPHFRTMTEHNNYVVDAYNSIINDEDTVYILGDLGSDIHPMETVRALCSKLKGNKILILGNHDKRTNPSFYEEWGIFKEVHKFPIYLNRRIVLSHEPVQVGDTLINIHGHLHNANLNLPNYMNVSAHMCNYKPLSLRTVNKKLMQMEKEDDSFLNEWYAENYMFVPEMREIRSREGKRDLFFNEDGTVNIEKSKKLRAKLGL